MTDEEMSDYTEYQKWEHGKLEDISHDIQALIRMTGDEKMGESYDSGLIAGMLQNKGIDPGILALLNDNKGAFGSDGGLLFLLFLVILMGGNGFGGWGGNGGINGIDRTVINEGNFNQLMTAVSQTGQNQASAIQTLANSLNVDTAQITSALAAVDKQIAVNNGDIRSAIQSCCCNIRTEMQGLAAQTSLGMERTCNQLSTQMLTGFNGLQNQASQIAFAQQQNANQNTQALLNALNAQTAMIQDEFCALRNREDQRTIQDLRDKLAEQRDNSNLAQILAAISNKDTIAYTGTVNGTTVTGTGSLS